MRRDYCAARKRRNRRQGLADSAAGLCSVQSRIRVASTVHSTSRPRASPAEVTRVPAFACYEVNARFAKVAEARQREGGRVGRPLLTTGLGTIGIQLVAFAGRSLLAGVAEIQFRMTSLRLEHIRSLAELPWFAAVTRLVFALAGRRLILAVPVLVGHAETCRK
jgi:hypothetical protein